MNCRLFVLLVVIFISTTASAERTLILARAPQLSPSIISEQWSPFVKYLSETAGTKVSLKVYIDRSEFESDIINGRVDLYFGNPGYGIVGNMKHGYIPLIRSDRKLLEGILVTRKGAGIENVQQLKNRIIAFPDEKAFAASLYMRSRLDSNFNINYQPIYVGSHDNVYRAVLIGKADAGSGVMRTLESEPAKLRDQLQIIYTTPGMKSHPLMAHPDIPVDVRQSIQQAILKLNTDKQGKKLLKTVKLQKPVVADYSLDYKIIEPLAKKMYRSLLERNEVE